MKDQIRVILFEDNKQHKESLEAFFKVSKRVFLTAAYLDADNALKRTRQHQPDVVLMDIRMPPGVSGLEAMQRIKAKEPDTKILIQTDYDDNHKIFTAVCSGASGYVLKSAGLLALEQAIVDVYHGGKSLSPKITAKVMELLKSQLVTEQPKHKKLTPTELKVLTCMAKDGPTHIQMADRLDMKLNTVRFHIKNIFTKLHVNCMAQAVIIAIRERLI
ncbi:MAG: response regulator transcription factor [Bacteroidota bacterium]